MKLSEFDYNLPKELVAQFPLKRRDNCRLMILDRDTKNISHAKFNDLLNYFDSGDILVLNDTRVIKARLIGRHLEKNKEIEVLLSEKIDDNTFKALIRPSKGLKKLDKISFENGICIGEIVDEKAKLICFNTYDILGKLESLGQIPLPPYIKRPPQGLDNDYYQTIYAKKDGSIAAPTAGLHFTREFLGKIAQRGVNICFLTSHIGYSTFSPVRVEDVDKHNMDKENFYVPAKTLEILRYAKANGKKIVSVGTSTTRVLETIAELINNPATADKENGWNIDNGSINGTTDLFIYPGYKFKSVDRLLTNFHLPKSTLIMLVCAFAGRDGIMSAYSEAIKEKYRFYSYGDAMLII